MKYKLKLHFKNKNFSFTNNIEGSALIVELKGEWDDSIAEHYAMELFKFTRGIEVNNYTLVLKCSEFKVSIPYLKQVLRPFLQWYKDIGFKHVRLITENPQKEFRRLVKTINQAIGFELQFCDSRYIDQEVYI